MDEIIQGIAIYALPVIFAITLHEAAHGYIARHFGDFTAHNEGRISLNPIRHIDPVGTILVPLSLFILSKLTIGAGFLFGWAKPVPVNFSNLRQPKRDMLWVAAAGPGANLLMAFFWALMIKLAIASPDSSFAKPLALMGIAGIEINVILMVLNLLPLPPLDGGRMAVSLLPHRLAYQFSRIEPYGFMILLVLLFSGVLGAVIGPMITWAKIMIVSIFGLYI
ncbi:site-2 protease family protein [Nitrosomonas ureae]|uniref:Zn-dependent protease (Includes SpoIVFB) n=1 Tax=Nitrosomonas ureae TaxID=44577 RepID=A0A0S3AHC0_9PROT|nr:site-2 protease family protein [Nitrosomonas ureae]ALQ50513.1 peptidase M50 [Nitrosomonas ureae]SDT86258.1 Zn-dependent protease (includes SpoIVFB) [Nitrosomonas ureae]SEP81976.1 Zn-dependent protease (includes SpoIVFB) [Nitrosomonas ureae]